MSQRPLDNGKGRFLVVLAVEAGGQPDRVTGVKSHVLRHALGEGLTGHVPGKLEECNALLG